MSWLESIRLYDGMEVVDDYTFKWKLKEAYFPMLIEFGVIRPFRFISPKAFKDGTTKGGVNAYIGTGAYVLKSNTLIKKQYLKEMIIIGVKSLK